MILPNQSFYLSFNLAQIVHASMQIWIYAKLGIEAPAATNYFFCVILGN
jgi:hypothetical protein